MTPSVLLTNTEYAAVTEVPRSAFTQEDLATPTIEIASAGRTPTAEAYKTTFVGTSECAETAQSLAAEANDD